MVVFSTFLILFGRYYSTLPETNSKFTPERQAFPFSVSAYVQELFLLFWGCICIHILLMREIDCVMASGISVCFSSTLIHPSSCWQSRSTKRKGICGNDNATGFADLCICTTSETNKGKEDLQNYRKKKIHGFKNKSNWGAYQFQFRLFVKDNFQTFFRLFHLKKRQWISMYHPSSFRNRCKLLRLSRQQSMSALIQLFALQKLHKSHQKQSSEGCD